MGHGGVRESIGGTPKIEAGKPLNRVEVNLKAKTTAVQDEVGGPGQRNSGWERSRRDFLLLHIICHQKAACMSA